MLKSCGALLNISRAFLKRENVLNQQLRTTFILKRRNRLELHKKEDPPRKLRAKHNIYELVQDTDIIKHQEMNVVLTTYVEGLGKAGDMVSVRPVRAYNNLLLPGLAVYATPENIEKYCNKSDSSEEKHSSAMAAYTAASLSRMVLSVVMNKDTPWTLEPWHVSVSFRKCCYNVPPETIALPPKPITGPDMSLEGKQFYVTVTINNLEQAKVRCCLHHWSTDISERLPYVNEFWKENTEPIFPEDAPVLASMPKRV